MAALKQFNLPDVGEGLTEAEILKWRVKPGDTVTDGQVIVEIETEKAAVELPCPFDGTVAELLADEGATVDVGTPIITVDVGADEPSDERTSVLVGYGPRSRAATRRRRKNAVTPGTQESPATADADSGRPSPTPAADGGGAPTAVSESPAAAPGSAESPVALAKPPVRKLAKDRGVDLSAVTGSGPGGVITRADVESAAEAPQPAGRERRIPVRGVQKHMAKAMVASAFSAPHVSEFLAVDMTATLHLRERVLADPEFAGVKVSPLLFVAKALLLAVRRHPMVNSSWDEERQEIVVKDYVNLGIAAATERGLIVPNIKNADRLGLRDLAEALSSLTDAARAGKTAPEDLAGGTISITNVGVFGIDSGTPILPPGEAVILAFGAVRERPWVVDGQVVARRVSDLSVSFDHRIVDGQLGARFLADIGALLTDPTLALAYA